MDYKEKIEEKRKKMVDTLISFIEQDPTQWEAGWYRAPSVSPMNGKTQKNYKGLNAFYLYVIAAMKGYRDPRWLTFNQVKELGGNVRSGEKSSEVFFWTWYDKKTKKPFEAKTLEGMSEEEKLEYKKENVRPVIKFYQVFNGQQCENIPEYEVVQTPTMAEEERARQNDLIETVIANSEAPIQYNGGNRAYYSPMSDSIHLPEIKDFKTMQDYYATALHEIAHSTGHESRLNRSLKGMFGSPDYAREELRAELASVFMQTELGISVEGKHFENHGAYLASWLKAVKDNPKEFYSAASDAEKIADYVSAHYLKEHVQEEIYGIIYDWKGLKEENSLYTVQQLKELDPSFVADVEQYEGDFAGNKTYTAIKLTGETPVETMNNVRKFLTGAYNATEYTDSVPGWYWETVDTNLFTNEWNATTLEYIKRLDIKDEELRMSEEEEPLEEVAEETTAQRDEMSQPAEQVGQAELTPFQKARAEAERRGIEENLAYVVIEWSESNSLALRDNTIMTFDEADKMLDAMNDAETERLGYLKTKLDIFTPTENGGEWYSGCRFDIGSEKPGGLIPHMLYAFENSSQQEAVKAFTDAVVAHRFPQAEPAQQATQTEQVGQSKPAEQVGQVGQAEKAKQAKPAEQGRYAISIPPEQVGEEYGRTRMIRMPAEGEYSSFVLFAPKSMIRQEAKTGEIKLSVRASQQFVLKNDGLNVELNGSELCAALEGREVGKSAQRVAPSHRNAKRLGVLRANVPEEMRALPNWCVFRTKWNAEKGKKDKFIISPTDGKWAKSTDPATWTDFETAMRYAEENNCEGLSFALDGSGISCIDLDHSVEKDGTLSANAEKLTKEIPETYTETSVSGNGIHIFVKDDILAKGKYRNRAVTDSGEIEVYDAGRFISMTGAVRSGTLTLGKCPQATMSWLRQTLGRRTAEQNRQPEQRDRASQSDQEVIDRIRRSKKGSTFEQLYSGRDVTGDNSRNDFMLLNMLAFFTDCDPAQMERIFKSSGLYRPEKGEPYLNRSINKACSTLTARMNAPQGGQSRGRGQQR